MLLLSANSTITSLTSTITNSTLTSLTGTYGWISALIVSHGYYAIIALTGLEGASLPIPSEVVLPVIGYFVHQGSLNLYLALISTVIGTFIGITIDYYIAYRLGKDVVYKHAETFHIKKDDIEKFDQWFNKNAGFTLFVARLLPVVRGLISFPAGFAQMSLKKFYAYSLAGSFIWNFALIEFGFYALAVGNSTLEIGAIGLMIQMLYVVYRISIGKIEAQTREKIRKANAY